MATTRKTTKKPTAVATKKKPTPRQRKPAAKKTMSPLVYEISGLILVLIAILALFKLGVVGDLLQSTMKLFVGSWYIIMPFILIAYAGYMMIVRALPEFKNRFVWGITLLVIGATLFSQIALFKSTMDIDRSVLIQTWQLLVTERGVTTAGSAIGGGLVGGVVFALSHVLFDTTGSFIVAWIIMFIAFILITGRALVPYIMQQLPSWKASITSRRQEVREARHYRKAVKKQLAKEKPAKKPAPELKVIDGQAQPTEEMLVEEELEELPKRELNISAFTQNIQPIEAANEEDLLHSSEPQKPVATEEEEIPSDLVVAAGEAIIENKSYELPNIHVLKQPTPTDQSGEFAIIQENATKLEQTFLSFGVKATVTEVHIGPAVTEYEVLPDRGVKVSKIVNLQDDLALALAAKDIRIEAPIPGKSAVGIEVPNKEVAIVSLREVLESKENNKPDAKLLIGLGRDISGEAKLAQLQKMPHLLVAGSTGSGKSVCINGIIVSILMRAKPHEVKMMMIDPKMVELNVYNGIPHLLAPVVTDARKASQALKKVVSEMERRYELFSHTGTRNIEGYNNHVDRFNEENNEKHPRLPFIVVIVDELADLMMVASNDVEDSITRLAQMARAAGIHLIIATQRPSVDVITGVIKANIPSRIAFAVSSSIDSRTILDMGGAERLLGRGDMLFLPAGESKPVRVQGAFVSDEEVEEVVNFVISQQKAQYQEEMIPTEEVEDTEVSDLDELYSQAVDLVIESDTASVSFLQRKLKVGYARAARIMDQMEERGVVGPPEKSKPRQILHDRH
ncbi:FtsK/SpoIIIE family DNA translocase [Kurthia sibirica]|uniref:Cell division protein FtsK n=1 Tax=Kurthia sibirica TaxID=202750 RepID=A0A2U3AQW5_9BACL|nr:DNA translocase FtsK [Kurthia sibirica]PWI26948.1 cell division protein FtsK [Kurthia sibirica]GEK32509.1 DNA translocase SpoIIIE [Kurthia sibirica]